MSNFAAALTEYTLARLDLDTQPRVEPLDGGEDIVCQRHSNAIRALLMQDAETIAELCSKIEIYDREEIDDGWYMAREVTAKLAQDARRLINATA